MRRINVLLASGERRTSNLLEAAVLDVCFDQAVVEVTRTARIDELVHFGSRDTVDLILLAVDHLVAEPSRHTAVVKIEEVTRAVRLIREQRSTPMLAVAFLPETEADLLEAGADCVSVGLVLETDAIKSDLRRLLYMPETVESVAPNRWSFTGWLKGNQRLKSA